LWDLQKPRGDLQKWCDSRFLRMLFPVRRSVSVLFSLGSICEKASLHFRNQAWPVPLISPPSQASIASSSKGMIHVTMMEQFLRFKWAKNAPERGVDILVSQCGTCTCTTCACSLFVFDILAQRFPLHLHRLWRFYNTYDITESSLESRLFWAHLCNGSCALLLWSRDEKEMLVPLPSSWVAFRFAATSCPTLEWTRLGKLQFLCKCARIVVDMQCTYIVVTRGVWNSKTALCGRAV
jgi:hypothetical protein